MYESGVVRCGVLVPHNLRVCVCVCVNESLQQT